MAPKGPKPYGSGNQLFLEVVGGPSVPHPVNGRGNGDVFKGLLHFECSLLNGVPKVSHGADKFDGMRMMLGIFSPERTVETNGARDLLEEVCVFHDIKESP